MRRGAANSGLLVSIGLMIAFALGASALIINAKQQAHVDWQTLPSGTRYVVPPGYAPDRLEAALGKATDELSTVWPRPQVEKLVNLSEVVVMRDAEWVDAWGRPVGATSFGAHFQVANDLGPLVHELAHALELNFDHKVDELHLGWEAKGIWRADRTYRAWIAAGAAP